MKFIKLLIVCSLLSSVAFSSESKETKEKAVEKKPVNAFVGQVKTEELFDPIVFGGFIEPLASYQVFPPVSGMINKYKVKPGQRVTKGQVIALVHPGGVGLEYQTSKVQAPSAGIISKLNYKAGDKLLNSESLAEIANTSSYVTTIYITYDDLFKMKESMEVAVLVAPGSSNETKLNGKINSIDPQADVASGTYKTVVNLSCPEKDNKKCLNSIRLGAMVKVVVKQNLRKGILVSSDFLFERRKKVILVDKDNKVKWSVIKLGKDFGKKIEVIEGLKEGDRIVESFDRKPEDGDLVVITTPEQEMAKGAGKAKTESKDPKKG